MRHYMDGEYAPLLQMGPSSFLQHLTPCMCLQKVFLQAVVVSPCLTWFSYLVLFCFILFNCYFQASKFLLIYYCVLEEIQVLYLCKVK